MEMHDIVTLKKNHNGIKKGDKGTVLFFTEASMYVTLEFIVKGRERVVTVLKTDVN